MRHFAHARLAFVGREDDSGTFRYAVKATAIILVGIPVITTLAGHSQSASTSAAHTRGGAL